jgi:uncharacterized Zn finger protein
MSTPEITLSNFRDELDVSILERGWFYFKKGWVKNPREIIPGFFETQVDEVSSYAVSYSISKDGIFKDDFCTCGDVRSFMCRHKAALLFWLEAASPKPRS